MKNVLFIQFGDYQEAFYRLSKGEAELFHHQKNDVNFIINLLNERGIKKISVLCVNTRKYDEILPCGIRAMGMALYENVEKHINELYSLLVKNRYTHLIIRTPIREVMTFAMKKNIEALPLFADSFARKNIGSKIAYYFLAKALNNKKIRFVGNHNIPASLSLKNIGVDPQKIIPYDWSMQNMPNYNVKTLSQRNSNWKLIYVGRISKSKGVGDCIHALSNLLTRGYSVNLTVVGDGDINMFREMAANLNILSHVDFLGLVAHEKVIDLMSQHDVVIIPSRYECPEGFPYTTIEALVSKTPIVVSDHPVFRNKIRDKESGVVFPSGHPGGLAGKIVELLTNPELYYNISLNSENVIKSLWCPITWYECVRKWLIDSQDDLDIWIKKYSLASGIYNIL